MPGHFMSGEDGRVLSTEPGQIHKNSERSSWRYAKGVEMRAGPYGSGISHLNHLTRVLSSQISMSHLVPLCKFNHNLLSIKHLRSIDNFQNRAPKRPQIWGLPLVRYLVE